MTDNVRKAVPEDCGVWDDGAMPVGTPPLFSGEYFHDPGGKIRHKLLPGVKGDALFYGERREYRPLLRRWAGDEFPERFVTFIGMNPSTADASFNDPTIAKLWGFAVRWGFTALVMLNTADLRMTDPDEILGSGIEPCSTVNPRVRRGILLRSDLIVVCHGNLPKPARHLSVRLVRDLYPHRQKTRVFGFNADGSPKHPLYIRNTTELVPVEIDEFRLTVAPIPSRSDG